MTSKHPYHSAKDVLDGRTSRVVGNNTKLIQLSDDEIVLKYHDTYVVQVRRDGSMQLNTGGYDSKTTKERIENFIRPYGWTISGSCTSGFTGKRPKTYREWVLEYHYYPLGLNFWDKGGIKEVQFQDWITVYPNGKVVW